MQTASPGNLVPAATGTLAGAPGARAGDRKAVPCRSIRLGTTLLLAGLLLAGLVLAACAKDEDEAPFQHAPIILISLDTVRWDSASGFGADAEATPELLAFSQDAICFDNAIAASHHTAPSHASILTGFSPFVHGVALGSAEGVHAIPDSLPTLAEILRGAGYATGGFTDGIQLIPERGFHRGFDIYSHRLSGLPDKLPEIETFLNEHAGESFFLFAHTYRAHRPYRIPADLLDDVVGGYDGPYRRTLVETSHLRHEEFIGRSPAQSTLKVRLAMHMAASRAKSPHDLEVLRQAYDAGVTGADRELGALLDLLRETGVYDRAIIVVLSDHGESFNEHGTTGHRDLFDVNLRVPLALRLPQGAQAGRHVRGVFSSIRLVPTLLDLVGVLPEREPEGRSVAAALLDGNDIQEIPAFSALYMKGRDDPVVASLRTRDFKLFDARVDEKVLGKQFCIAAPQALFDLRDDPAERVNLFEKGSPNLEQLGQVLSQAERDWRELRRRNGLRARTTVEIAEQAQRDLRGLGYLGDD